MDKRVRNVTALGLFTVITVIAAVWGVYYLMGTPFWKNGLEVAVRLDDGKGLKRGDGVQLQGVQIGTVRSVGLTPSNEVVAMLRMNDPLQLPADTRATVTGDVFGAHTVELELGTAASYLENGDTIMGGATDDITALAATLSDQTQRVLSRAEEILGPEMIEDVHTTAASLPPAIRELRATFQELRETATIMTRTAEQLEAARPGEAVTSTVGEVQTTARALTAVAGRMDGSLDRLDALLAKVEGGEGTLGMLVNDSSLYLQFHETLREIQVLVADIRERPGRYINLKVF